MGALFWQTSQKEEDDDDDDRRRRHRRHGFSLFYSCAADWGDIGLSFMRVRFLHSLRWSNLILVLLLRMQFGTCTSCDEEYCSGFPLAWVLCSYVEIGFLCKTKLFATALKQFGLFNWWELLLTVFGGRETNQVLANFAMLCVPIGL